jgi:hypothetical protein
VTRFYADEQFPRRVVELVLAFAISDNRSVITLNRKDFFKLHRLNQEHSGIIACTDDRDRERLADNIHNAIQGLESLAGMEIRVRKPE